MDDWRRTASPGFGGVKPPKAHQSEREEQAIADLELFIQDI